MQLYLWRCLSPAEVAHVECAGDLRHREVSAPVPYETIRRILWGHNVFPIVILVPAKECKFVVNGQGEVGRDVFPFNFFPIYFETKSHSGPSVAILYIKHLDSVGHGRRRR